MNPYLPPQDAGTFSHQPSGGGAGVTELTVDTLRQTKPWVQIFGVLLLLGAAFMALGAVSIFAMAALRPSGGAAFTAALGLVYLPMAILYVYPGIKLWKYGSAIQRLMTSRDAAALEHALDQQKSFWKFTGIVAIVMVILYVVLFAVMMVGAIMAAGLRH